MGKIHDVLEKELGDIKSRISNNLKGLFISKGIGGQKIDLKNIYGISSDEAIIGIDCGKNKVLTDNGDTYDFNELEADILLWLVFEIEENSFEIVE